MSQWASHKNVDVVGICNAIYDLLYHVKEEDLQTLNLSKGIMHLVDAPRQQEILSFLGDRTMTKEIGGSTLNLIRLLAKLKQRTVFMGMVGKDEFGNSIKNRVESLGIIGKIYEHDTEGTGSCLVLVSPDGERTMNTHLGASCCFDAMHMPQEEIKQAKIFHFCGYQWTGSGQKRCIQEAIVVANNSNTLVSFDVADPFVVSSFRDDFQSLIRTSADIVFANRDEAELLYPGMSLEAIGHTIADTGAIAVIKLGSDGAFVVDRHSKEVILIEPHDVTVVDTTGAGDTFAAGFLYGLLNNKPLHTCGKIAATLATDVISRMGVHFSDTALSNATKL